MNHTISVGAASDSGNGVGRCRFLAGRVFRFFGILCTFALISHLFCRGGNCELVKQKGFLICVRDAKPLNKTFLIKIE